MLKNLKFSKRNANSFYFVRHKIESKEKFMCNHKYRLTLSISLQINNLMIKKKTFFYFEQFSPFGCCDCQIHGKQ